MILEEDRAKMADTLAKARANPDPAIACYDFELRDDASRAVETKWADCGVDDGDFLEIRSTHSGYGRVIVARVMLKQTREAPLWVD